MPTATLPPLLPPELERVIFGLAAHFWPLSIPTLMLVAWRVKEWVEPLLYRTITFRDGELDMGMEGHPTVHEDGKAFVALLKSRPASFFRDAVRHVLLTSNTPRDVAEFVLSVCSGVENLWILVYEDLHDPLLPLMGHLFLKQLYCNLQRVFGSAPIDFTHNLFSQMTHLELFDIPDSDPQFWSGIVLIPHLTHLAFNDLGFLPMGPTLLRTCSSLRLLILLSPLRAYVTNHPQIEELAKDGRFVLLFCPRYFEDWQMGAHTGIDYWSRAEDFVAKRRSGQIDRLQYELPGDESRKIA